MSDLVKLNPNQVITASALMNESSLPKNSIINGHVTKDTYEAICQLLPEFKYGLVNGIEGYGIDESKSQGSLIYQQALEQVYKTSKQTKREIINDVDQVKNFYVTKVIISQFTEDALNPDVSSGEILGIDYDQKGGAVNKALIELQKSIDFDGIARSITPDIIANGEYTLLPITKFIKDDKNKETVEHLLESKVDEETIHELESANETGVLSVHDNIDQTDVTAVRDFGDIRFFLVIAEDDTQVSIMKRPKSDFIQFSLDYDRVRVDLHRQFNATTPEQKKELAKIPRFVSIGKSFIHPFISKIRELELLEKLVPVTKLAKLSSGTIVSVQVGQQYDVKKAMRACRTIESVINENLTVNEGEGHISIESALASVGRVKVIPNFGDKGSIASVDTMGDIPDNLFSETVEMRKIILDSIGVPFELIYSADSDRKGDILRRYARYLRKLKSIQSALKRGFIDLACLHLSAKGIPFDKSKIRCNFRNKLIELDNIDKLEFVDTTISFLDNVKGFVENLVESDSLQLQERIDLDKLVEFLRQELSTLGLEDLVMKTGKKLQPQNKPDDEKSPPLDDPEPEQEEPKDEPEGEPSDA